MNSRPNRLDASLVALVAAVSAALNADLDEPPRFDGAGYASIATSLAEGHGYRQADHPDRPPHAHFPPGYPLALAALWGVVGRSAPAAHILSIACTTAAAVATWAWLRRRDRRAPAILLGLAVAVNWAWGRTGGSIQSEPLALLLGASALLASDRAARRGDLGSGALLGLLTGAGVLVRHAGAAMAAALLADLLIRGRFRAAAAGLVAAAVVVAPWAAWVAIAPAPSQADLVPHGGLGAIVGSNALFYMRRLPDALAGPIVEVGTVFAPRFAAAADVVGAVGTGVMLAGLALAAQRQRRRPIALATLATLALLLLWPFTEAGRFLIPMVPGLVVGAAEAVGRAARRRGFRRPRTWAAGLVLAASLPYPLYAIASGRAAAARSAHAEFDAACGWIARRADRPGPLLTRYPGEAFWQTGRPGIAPPEGATPAELERLIADRGVAYLLIDAGRFAAATADPLARLVADRPGRYPRAWPPAADGGRPAVAVFAVGP